jgi:hypothetical protein
MAYGQTSQTNPSTSSLREGNKIKAEVVSVDPAGKTITVQKAMPAESKARTGGTGSTGSGTMDKDQAMVLKVDDAAAASLSKYKAGDKVTLTCKDAGSMGSSGSTEPSGSTGSTAGTATMEHGSMVHCDTVVKINKSY